MSWLPIFFLSLGTLSAQDGFDLTSKLEIEKRVFSVDELDYCSEFRISESHPVAKNSVDFVFQSAPLRARGSRVTSVAGSIASPDRFRPPLILLYRVFRI